MQKEEEKRKDEESISTCEGVEDESIDVLNRQTRT
jgi:hypothetical protein